MPLYANGTRDFVHECVCGNRKHPRAKICRECYNMLVALTADSRQQKVKRLEYDACPDCGHKKLVTSKRCITCHLEHLRKPMPRCKICGAEKKSRNGELCRPCANEVRRNGVYHGYYDRAQAARAYQRRMAKAESDTAHHIGDVGRDE